MATLVETLGKELEALDAEYGKDFAGHSRMTRDTSQLDRMIKRAKSVVERADAIPEAARGADLTRLRDSASQSLSLYTNEREAIVRAQQVGPAFEQFSMEATSANLVFARYVRHFAGQNRATRDLALLADMAEQLKQIDKRMTQLLSEGKNADLERDREVVRQNLSNYQKEIDLVEKAQTTGTDEEIASTLATLANEQFGAYQTHFAGEPRISRRPALLMRIISTLKKIREQMDAIQKKGFAEDFNQKNIAIVDDRLATYEQELAEIRKLRQATPMTDIMGELGTAANKLFDEYRKEFADKARNQVDIKRLGQICDKLGEVRRQMVEMSWAEDNEMNTRNLDIVTEQISMFEGEFEAVARAQAEKK